MPIAFRPLRHATSRLLICLLVAATVGTPAAQVASGRETTAASVAGYPLSADMPVDPEVMIGGLPNGLRYYIRPNPRPARQAELRLVVKAGSVLEDDDQRGLAHFVEHMQFQGSRHFPGQTIDNFLASIGLSIGSDANAVTSFDDTRSSLRVPTDRPDILDQALTVLEDWAGGALFADAAIERQRAIVLAEWRRNLGADERTADKMRHVQLEGSRYADRPPVGDPAVIRTAQREQLLRYVSRRTDCGASSASTMARWCTMAASAKRAPPAPVFEHGRRLIETPPARNRSARAASYCVSVGTV